jgi:glutathione S-transferase
MTRILMSSASPFANKVMAAAAHAKIPFEAVVVDTNADPALLVDANPLGKIPVLLTDEGEAVYDSRVITQYLNRVSGNALFPRNAGKRLEAERLEALADGIADCLLAHVYERRFRPEEKIHKDWLDRQWSKVERGLDHLNGNLPRLGKKAHVGHIALRCMLAYNTLRFGSGWGARPTKAETLGQALRRTLSGPRPVPAALSGPGGTISRHEEGRNLAGPSLSLTSGAAPETPRRSIRTSCRYRAGSCSTSRRLPWRRPTGRNRSSRSQCNGTRRGRRRAR